MRILSKILLIVLVCSFFSCAAIFKGNIRAVPINSDPNGADIYVNGQFMGKTPLNIKLQNNQSSYTVEFKKQGYETQVYNINRQIGAGWIILDILSGFVPIIIDAVTGAWYELEPDSINATLQNK